MKRKIWKFSEKYLNYVVLASILIVLCFVVLTNPVSARFSLGTANYSIQKIYGPNSSINGWANLSFENELINSVFRGSFYENSNIVKTGDITLEKILENNPDYEYSCDTAGCKKSYSVSGNGENIKQFNLGENSNIFYGMKIMGNNFNEINEFSFDVSTDAIQSEFPQLTIDILDDGDFEWVPYKPSGTFGFENYGCYKESNTRQGIIVSNSIYKNKIQISPTPNLKIGAYVEKNPNAQGSAGFSMTIENENSEEGGYCEILNVANSGTIECIPVIDGKNFSVTEEGDFIISIWARNYESEGKFKIKYYTNNSCIDEGNFKIFVKPGIYSAPGNFKINNTEIERISNMPDIEGKISDYIQERYNGDCENACIIPIKFVSQTSQQIVISNAELRYKNGNIVQAENLVYPLTDSPPRISSNYNKLFLKRGELKTPEFPKNYTFKLEFNNHLIFEEKIEIKNVSIIKSITPSKTASFVPTEFIANIDSPANTFITSYYWDFGNDATKTTPINKTTNTYQGIGKYVLSLTITDNRGISSSQNFEIEVESPKEIINTTLEKNAENIGRIKNYIGSRNFFQQKGINSSLKLNNLSSELDLLKQRYDLALQNSNSEQQTSEMNSIVTQLLNMKIPERILKTKQADSFMFIPKSEDVELERVKISGGGDYSSAKIQEYQNSIVAWQIKNLDVHINFSEFSADYESGTEPIVRVFELRTNEKNNITYDYYLIIPKLENTGFDREIQEQNGFYSINLKNNPEISFYTTENIDISQLPVFISPSLSRLNLSAEVSPKGAEKNSKQIIFILSIAILLILGVIAYIMINKWYKNKYEKHLFPNRSDLYNIIKYVNISKRKGATNKEISEHLKKAEWSSEQIKYIIKKYEKNTGKN